MFVQPQTSTHRWRAALLFSFALHAVAVYLLVRPPRPVFITPVQVAFGHGGTSVEPIYFVSHGSSSGERSTADVERRHFAYHAPPRAKPATRTATPSSTSSPTAETAARAGSPFGSLLNGPVSGHDVRPALPLVFPNPDIFPWQVPSGIEGNVVVEITIDAEGKVTETRLLQGLGHGIEERVIAALRNWRFRPAMMDGRAIPSQQDVYFHFPS